ncbi:putative secreted beta-glucosidase [Clavispora lusitaniae]|uniref:Secreted beta-glucosidase n=3 Tax=Clavispora lusitaniae TaxID=36911 RepID=C4XVU5_CLAL4|nr:uncharacterized protein CLUG_00078 [Clavispora lusitaniae ATCC 42720]KAF5213493.1 putative secreted beta-glucosidase sim1 [Clavispora lusitaniae]EEQ35955.1 hypothetical protein CLUG_00078 [Clavispora lusitaniae ATCC 42720]OVF06622.1 putative secreted beta-glucosidase [Clavispora lusitaniae]QFZ25006.1 putative secreted beta-glucosidase [Clavispora lusitaniae]QFZ31691.1 putative secreted beta-glucosidase [Clavispora lusitaniae]
MKASIALSALLALASAAPSRMHHHHEHKRDVVTVTVGENAESALSKKDSSAPPASSPSSSGPASGSSSGSAPSAASSGSSSGSGSSSISGDLSAFADPTVKFEDGVHDCSTLPTGQGVIAVDWISGLNGGYTSIMNLNGDTSSTCQDGFYCSYACQAGMSKTQWPSNQPSNGMSVGGLQCKNGKLYRSNPDSDYLCEWGSQTADFVSKLDKDVAICRTDYPGSENMNVPTLLSAGGSTPCTVVDSDTYFKWNNGKTSAQYYVNNAGVSVEDGCIWGDASSGVGNWAPVVLGAGTTGGNTYLSLIPNPNNKQAPNYSIEIKGADGASTVGSCSYVNGQYNGGDGSDGCTLTLTSGKAQFVFY